MPEQPLDQAAIVNPEGQVNGWEIVARNMKDWHPYMQEHARRNLEARGFSDTPGTEDMQDLPTEMSDIAEAVASYEKSTTSSAEITWAFIEGQHTLYKLSADPLFHASCREQQIDPHEDMDKPAYWNAVADYAHQGIVMAREKDGDTLQLRVLELLSATPAYLFEQRALSKQSHASGAERRHGREVASYFNGLVREFASEFPETRASSLTTSLLNVANIALEDKAMRQSASEDVQRVIRGAQHEMAFGQILEKTGYIYRPASLDEDLKGIDYVLQEAGAQPMYIDVKASLSEIEARGSSGAYVRKPDGKIVMYSLVKDSELRDTFYLPDNVASAKAVALTRLLVLAQQVA